MRSEEDRGSQLQHVLLVSIQEQLELESAKEESPRNSSFKKCDESENGGERKEASVLIVLPSSSMNKTDQRCMSYSIESFHYSITIELHHMTMARQREDRNSTFVN